MLTLPRGNPLLKLSRPKLIISNQIRVCLTSSKSELSFQRADVLLGSKAYPQCQGRISSYVSTWLPQCSQPGIRPRAKKSHEWTRAAFLHNLVKNGRFPGVLSFAMHDHIGLTAARSESPQTTLNPKEDHFSDVAEIKADSATAWATIFADLVPNSDLVLYLKPKTCMR